MKKLWKNEQREFIDSFIKENKIMKILLSNDDGIHATGIRIIKEIMTELGHEVYIIAPERQHSGTSHTITLSYPLIPKNIYHEDAFYGIAINGSPADCVKLGVSSIYPDVDMVISGINLGQNVGPSIHYSGTVGAAFEGICVNKTAIAFSLDSFDEKKFKGLKEKIQPFIPQILNMCTEKVLYNINFPVTEKIEGIKITRQYQTYFKDKYEKCISPRGREYYWIAKVEYTNESQDIRMKDCCHDVKAIKEGYISVSPLQFDNTNYKEIIALKERLGEKDV